MRLTTKGRLAVVSMIDVALHHKSGPTTLAHVARRQQISISYLEQMFSDLRRHGLVAATRGPGGGYTLGRDAAIITVADIVAAVDRAQGDRGQAARTEVRRGGQQCLTPELWSSLSDRVVEFLQSVNLQSLVDEQIANGVEVESQPTRRPEPLRTRVKPPRPAAPNSVFELGKFLAR